MTWIPSSDAPSSRATGGGGVPSDLRSLIHHELRMLAYYEPLPGIVEAPQPKNQPELGHDAQFALSELNQAGSAATVPGHTWATPATAARPSRWSPSQWRATAA